MVALPPVLNIAPSRVAILIVSICLALFLLANLNNHGADFRSVPWISRSELHDAPKTLADIHNSTLGFERIVVINLPERSDKRDALSLAASLTNLTFSYVDGVRGQEVVNKSLPKGIESRPFEEPMLGSWRAHMNAIRTIVEEGLSSALILEDDVDWDIKIKYQLNDFARGTRYLQNQSISDPTHSPYGDGWDVLWVGHCHDNMDKQDTRTYTIRDDPTIPPVDKLHLNRPSLLEQWPDHTRVVHVAGSPICTFGYALSYRGAQKILYALSVKELRGLFDNALSWWCKDKHQNARCLDAHPAFFSQHRAAGGAGKNSDNQKNSPATEVASTYNVRWSTRLNLERLLTVRNIGYWVGNVSFYRVEAESEAYGKVIPAGPAG